MRAEFPPLAVIASLAVGMAAAPVGLQARAAPASSKSFPGPKSDLPSPDGKWRIVNRDPDDSDHPHTLVLHETNGGGERTLYEYGRSVRVAWSPDSRRIAITDYVGSNVAECVVVDRVTFAKRDVMAEAQKSSARIAGVMRNFHSYFECPRWTSNRDLRIHVWGYGDHNPKGAEIVTTYRLKSE